MSDSVKISPLPPRYRSQDYAFLREQGLSIIQALAADTWTDHNLHDPGITLLEAISYAITELGLRAGMDIPDLLSSSAVDRPPEMFTAAQVLPCAPVTITDFRKLLVDHPLINNAWVFPQESEPKGRLDVLLEFKQEELNNNTFSINVSPPTLTSTYQVDLALPFWDEPDVESLREDVILQNVVFDGTPGTEWSSVEGSNAYFSRASITYLPQVGGSQDLKIWIVAQITTSSNSLAVDTPQILDAVVAEIATLGDSSSSDQTLLKQYNRRIAAAHENMRIIRRFTRDHRNLCQRFIEYRAVRQQEVAIFAILEVNGGVNIEDLLAQIFLRIDIMISPQIQFGDVGAQLADRSSAEEVFEGPLLDSGILTNSALGEQQIIETIYSSDVLRIIFQLRDGTNQDVVKREDPAERDIISVRNLTLSNFLDNRPISTNAKDCLRLVSSKRHVPRLSLTKSRIVIYRNSVEIPYDLDRVIELFRQKKRDHYSDQIPGTDDLHVPMGDIFDIGDYYPVQNDLPKVYGVGEVGLPAHADDERRSQARQLKGYLFPVEQILAGFVSQLRNFNRFFSADPLVSQTLYQQPLYHIGEAKALLKAFDSDAESWEDFTSNPANKYEETLKSSVETEGQFLTRRNAVLDHLLSSIGYDMHERAALLLRRATDVDGSNIPLPDLIEQQLNRRFEAQKSLIRDKSAFYYDLPLLSRDRSQAYGNLIWRTDILINVEETTSGLTWSIQDEDGTPLLRSISPLTTFGVVQRQLAMVLSLATVASAYNIRIEGAGQLRLEIRTSVNESPIAESSITYGSNALAQTGIQDTAQEIRRLWLEYALTPLEGRLYHFLGINSQRRRLFLHAENEFIEIFDEVDADGIIEKRFRLWHLPGFAGDRLLESEGNFPGSTDAEATADARAAVQNMMMRGGDSHNYRVDNPAVGVFDVLLLNADGSILARSPTSFLTREEAAGEIDRISAHLYFYYSAQGLYLIEHHLLYPDDATGPHLTIPSVLKDPYSQQLTIVLPSGYARDFSLAETLRQPAQPELFRSNEFKKYVEDQVRRHCPADILPRVLWVDRALPTTPVSVNDPSFDRFEQAYRDWLEVYFTDEVTATDVQPVRDALIDILNLVYVDGYTS